MIIAGCFLIPRESHAAIGAARIGNSLIGNFPLRLFEKGLMPRQQQIIDPLAIGMRPARHTNRQIAIGAGGYPLLPRRIHSSADILVAVLIERELYPCEIKLLDGLIEQGQGRPSAPHAPADRLRAVLWYVQ